MKALIIDDNEQILDVLSFFFESNNMEHVTVNNGKQGFKAIMESIRNPGDGFDLIFLDLAMPEMSGFQVIDLLRRENALKEIKAIVLTALDLSEEEEKALISSGVTAVLRKPIDLDDVESILEKYSVDTN